MEVVNIYQAKAQLSRLIKRACDGERIVLARAGKPLVELCRYVAPVRKAGLMRGKIQIADDFDAPLPDFEEDVYGSSENAA